MDILPSRKRKLFERLTPKQKLAIDIFFTIAVTSIAFVIGYKIGYYNGFWHGQWRFW